MAAPVQFGFIRGFARFARDRRAMTAVEFALLLPLMITLYLAGAEITQAITIKRKATIVARTIGDLVAQDNSITNAEMSTILGAASAVVSPYPSGPLKIIVSSLAIDGNGIAKVAWSEAYQTAARTVNSTVTLPPGLNAANTSLVWAESSYNYTPAVGYMITGSMELRDQVYLRPRLSTSIARVP
jgi:Flp pilus assembly protein TadG